MKQDNLFIALIAFFVGWSILSLFTSSIDLAIDRLFGVIFVTVVWMAHLKSKFPNWLLGIGGATLALHYVKLYGNIYLGIPFDHIMHVIGSLVVAIFVIHWLFKVTKWNGITLAIITILITMGFGALLELLEFIGYSYLSSGEGILFYGTGDFGAYNNIGWDILNNFIGSIVGSIIYLVKFKINKKGIGDLKSLIWLIVTVVVGSIIIHWIAFK